MANTNISGIDKNDLPAILDICVETFKNVMSPGGIKSYIKSTVDWNLSRKATDENGEIIGCYLFNTQSVWQFHECQTEDLTKYKDLRGIQGVALAVKPEYRGAGIGHDLRDIPLHMNYDYIWGQHLKGLHNIDNWTKFGRRVVADCDDLIVTLMDLKKNLTENFERHHSYQEAGHTCGPTCVKMVADYLGVKYKDSDAIIQLCNCNDQTGTVDTGIKNALDNLKIKNMRNPYLGDMSKSVMMLNQTLQDGNVFIMRTLTKSIKHWIVVYGKDQKGDYLIADPWLGKIHNDLKTLLSKWKPREFDGFIVKK